MSLRGSKRATGARSEEPSTSKRRRTEPEDALWQLRPVSDLKMSSIYNRSASEAPAELFRKDLISAMKLPDSEPLTPSEYWVITDTWKQDWERGVQVPVNPDSLPAPKVKVIENPLPPDFENFRLPKDKYIHLSRDAHYQADKHFLSATPARAEAACSYDLDATDTAWLKLLNAERARAGVSAITEDQLEKVIEDLEVRTWDKIQAIMKSEEGLGIEYDENVICDVCRSPDSEDGNEMVFCDSCNICVHQACYGITVIPDGTYGHGQWLCRPCGAGVRPTCALCPNLGGAMKCTPNGHKWAHVSCVLWIPEVSIGCAEKMEPITKISSIPPSRWSLVCVLCRERKGACIQCSVKTCKIAYHVTCAFKHGLEMRAIIEDENADDGVKLRSYCQKHSVNSKKEKCSGSGSEEEEVKRKRRKDMTSEEKTQARAARLQEIEREFDRHVSVKDISSHLLEVDQDAINYIYNYWKLKRRSGHNRPLLPPKSDDTELLTHRQEQADLDKMKMFVQLRQDLERVRNLCYMVSRREKLSRSFFRIREQTFHKQIAVLSAEPGISGVELAAIIEANHGPSIYDRLYSHPNARDHKNDFQELLSRIAPQNINNDKKKERNGHVKGSKAANPYKKHYVNGSRRSGSMYSGLSSEESSAEVNRSGKYRGRTIESSTDDDVKKTSTSPKKKVSPKGKGKRSPKKSDRKKKKTPSKTVVESSSEDETYKARMKKDRSRSKTLQQMEKEMDAGKSGLSGTDSDELMPIRSTRNNKFPVDIYSDSSEDTDFVKTDLKSGKAKPDKAKTGRRRSEASLSGIDSQQSLPRTKAAMKEFISTHSERKSLHVEDKPAPKKRGRKPSNKNEKKTPAKPHESDDDAKNKENIKFLKQKDNPTDLIVPQRQAAKKASENMRSTTARREESSTEKPASGDDSKSKPKVRSKGKEAKDIPAKVGRKKSVKETEKETIAYVPQRQAAKKAAAHIKSGLGSKLSVIDQTDIDKKRETEKSETMKYSPKKNVAKSSKASIDEESTSSSSNSSSSSYSSSTSSEEEQEKPCRRPSAKAREIKPISKQPSMFSPPGSRPTVDLPFLDKVSRPLSSTSASSDSDSYKESRYSGSESPSPKRPRRPRRGKSFSTDTSPRKALDKKLKTSERESECRVSSPTVEREESCGANDTRAATRSRTRSVTASGNMSNNFDTRQRKSSKDDIKFASDSNKTPKERSQSREFSITQREENEKIRREIKIETAISLEKAKNCFKTSSITRRSVSIEEKDIPIASYTESLSIIKVSPRKSVDIKQKDIIKRRLSVKDLLFKDLGHYPENSRETITRPRPMSRCDSQSLTLKNRSSFSPIKKVNMEPPSLVESIERKIPSTITEDFAGSEKHWLPKAPSPHVHPPPVEKPGGHEKYMTEDKSLDSDCTDKSSIKMIAKIQANLNENTMIKSPKTPMDARTIILDPIEENPLPKILRKRSVLDPEKKFTIQDASHVQGVEISKSAKIPSALNSFSNRTIFSPQSKDNELFEFDILDDEGFNHEDIMKPFTTYPEFLFKEDSKEQGVQETLNLVDRLRMQLSSKKAPPESSTQNETITLNEDTDGKDEANRSTIKTAKDQEEILKRSSPAELHDIRSPDNESHPQNSKRLSIDDDSAQQEIIVDDKVEESAHLNKEKWSDFPMSVDQKDSGLEPIKTKYDHTITYNEDTKEPIPVHSDAQSVSEVGDTISLSKQSDDSQSLSVVDHSLHSNDQDLSQDNQTYDNNNSLIHSDCATISSPYISRDSKWRESKITTRRSSDSSTNSEGSMCSQKTDLKSHLNTCDSHPGTMMSEIDQYAPIPTYSCAVEPPIPLNQYTSYPPDASPFLNSMGTLPLFAASACASSQLSLPSPGPGLYASGLSFAATPLIQTLPKPPFPLCAAFTTSSQNIALTTAMIAPPTPKPLDSPHDDIDVTGSDKFSIHLSSPSISVDSYNEASNTRPPTKMSIDSNETMSSLHPQESKSPPKTTKPMPKFSSKSPGKSPGISPKQSDVSKGSKRPNNRNNRSHRGRGRSKSRGQAGHVFPATEFTGNSIQSKLVGTVYDFDEELANDGVDLKALREKRKSVDLRDDRKSDQTYKDSTPSPRTLSPQQSKKPVTEIKETKAKSPEPRSSPESPSSQSNPERTPGFSQVQPVLPGPVDMRTYHQPFDTPAPPVGDGFHSHLLAFASGTADQPLIEIDEEVEKLLHSALMASKPGPGDPNSEVNEPTKELPQMPKVSLSDSRNQLKVKIKGPFLDANYSASSVQPAAPQPPAPVHESNSNTHSNATIGSASTMMTGSTNLRRMRKKELLRQYWTQDMNMDDPTNTSNTGAPPPPAAPQPLPRAVITIPKAVASMTSIPTREDYKIIDTPIEKKKRKVSGVNRELRHLEVTMNDDVESSDDVKLSSYSNTNQTHKRRGRVSKPSRSSATSPVAPKLKIKIGSNIVQQVNDEPSGFQFRPPKKRLTSIPKPSLEDLRRESMKYRRMVMADFEENEKTKKFKPNKSEKRKKKKDKKLEKEKLQVINSESDSATKLIIKIKRKKEEEGKAGLIGLGPGGPVASTAAVSEPPVDPFEYDPTAPDPLAIDPSFSSDASSGMRKIRTAKVTPIRLKLARSSQGSGYVMKEASEQANNSASSHAEVVASNSSALPVSVNKHCEVR